ncbi:MAG: phosphate uptake regulator PhoU [Sulfolobaceae archaeon]
MEVRRVQKFGKSTLMVSLPADWVKEVGLVAGDSVYIEVDEDGSLRIYPSNIKIEASVREVKVNISNTVSPELLTRIIYAYYILGIDKITIETKNGTFTEEILKKIKEAARNLIGFEIVNQSIDTVQIQSFLDPTKYNMSNLLLRLSNTLKQMFHYLSLGLKEASRMFLQEVIELEKEIDRLYYLALRQLILTQINRNLSYMIGVKRVQIVGNRILIKAIEEAADEISEAANDLLTLHPSELELMKIAWKKLDILIEQTTVAIDHAIKVITKEDFKLANEVLEELRTMRRVLLTQATMIEDLVSEIKNPKILSVIRVINLRLYNAIRRMEPIAEIAFNRSIENIKELDVQ